MIWYFLIIVALLLFYLCGTKNHKIFIKSGIPGPKPWLWLGNCTNLPTPSEKDAEIVKMYGKVFGFFDIMTPILFVADPELVKLITIKMFDKFRNHRRYPTPKQIQNSIFFLCDEEWKYVRHICTSAFSTTKLRKTINSIDQCTKSLVVDLRSKCDIENCLEIKKLLSSCTMNIMVCNLFNIDLTKNTAANAAFTAQAIKTIEGLNNVNWVVVISAFFPFTKPIFDYFNTGFIPEDGINFLASRIYEILKAQSRNEKNSSSDDFLHILLDALSDESEIHKFMGNNGNTNHLKKATKIGLTKEDIVANCLHFLVVGHGTITETIAWAIHLLAINQNQQEKLYEEIKRSIATSNLAMTYEEVTSLTYLDQIICETLRLYSFTMRIDRVCNETCEVGPYIIKKDQIVQISIRALHYDVDYWENPNNFNPDRFAPENRKSIIPYSYMPFGSGPRKCIGTRMALLQSKVVLARLVQNFKFLPCEKTEVRPKIKTGYICTAKNGLWVTIEKRIP